MGLEIERKFLVKNTEYKKESHDNFLIEQGFLNSHKKRTVRVRIAKNKGYITVKGKSDKRGLTRYEWEKEISLTEAKALLKLCEKDLIKKKRFLVNHENTLFEVDEFLDENKGLTIAEVELAEVNSKFDRPNWLDKEVTGNINYYNSMLSKKPYKSWEK